MDTRYLEGIYTEDIPLCMLFFYAVVKLLMKGLNMLHESDDYIVVCVGLDDEESTVQDMLDEGRV